MNPLVKLSQDSAFLLTCHVSRGVEPLQFEWFKDGRKIISGLVDFSRYQIDTKTTFSFLTLKRIQSNDSGNFSCVASNQFGFDTQWSILEVTGLKFCFNFICTIVFESLSILSERLR